MSLVNDSLKFTLSDTQICWNFWWKNVSSFCSAKATHIFSAKNIRILYIESAKTVNEMTLNELVKLTMLWTTGVLHPLQHYLSHTDMMEGWNVRFCAMMHGTVMSWILPPMGFQPGSLYSEVRSANHSATQTLTTCQVMGQTTTTCWLCLNNWDQLFKTNNVVR